MATAKNAAPPPPPPEVMAGPSPEEMIVLLQHLVDDGTFANPEAAIAAANDLLVKGLSIAQVISFLSAGYHSGIRDTDKRINKPRGLLKIPAARVA